MERAPPPEKDALSVRCFGDFAVFWRGEPLSFARRKTPELLALLIDRRGAPCSAEERAAVLWEDQADVAAAKHSLRALVQDLRHTLSAIGMEDVLLRRRGLLAIRVERVDCDYYRLLAGDAAAVNEYHGLRRHKSFTEPFTDRLIACGAIDPARREHILKSDAIIHGVGIALCAGVWIMLTAFFAGISSFMSLYVSLSCEPISASISSSSREEASLP